MARARDREADPFPSTSIADRAVELKRSATPTTNDDAIARSSHVTRFDARRTRARATNDDARASTRDGTGRAAAIRARRRVGGVIGGF